MVMVEKLRNIDFTTENQASIHQVSIDRGLLIVCSRWNNLEVRLYTGRLEMRSQQLNPKALHQ